MKHALMSKPEPPDETIAQMVEFAERARREGLLALEEVTKGVEDPFLRKGIELAVDGTDPDELREILENDVTAIRAEQGAGAKLFENMGGFAPTLGIIGTVLGLVHVLQNLSDPGKLGSLIAGAFIATLWVSCPPTCSGCRSPTSSAHRRSRRSSQGAADRGHPLDPGRGQPEDRPAAAAVAPADEGPAAHRPGGVVTCPRSGSALLTTKKSTRTPSAGCSPTPT